MGFGRGTGHGTESALLLSPSEAAAEAQNCIGAPCTISGATMRLAGSDAFVGEVGMAGPSISDGTAGSAGGNGGNGVDGDAAKFGVTMSFRMGL